MKHLKMDIHGAVAVITLDVAGKSANIFNDEVFDDLNRCLDELELRDDLKGLVFISAKDSIFIAGADLKTFGKEPSAEKLERILKRGQSTFSRIADLPLTSVAAIHGACLGGGYELALACDYRIATPARATKIGLPEILLGILPAWGGSVRLPKLIGLHRAMPIILSGKAFAAIPARKRGMVDEIVRRERLLARAEALAIKPKDRNGRAHWSHVPPVPAILRMMARRDVLRKTRGNYPAPLEALEVMTQGAGATVEEGLHLERQAFLRLMETEESRHLIELFLLQDEARKRVRIHAQGDDSRSIERAAVVGAGVMGAGIAQWLGTRKIPTLLKDVSAEALARGMRGIRKLTDKAVARRILTDVEGREAVDRITPVDTEVDLSRTDLIIEAVVEKLDLKRKVLANLEARAGEHTLLATNTSALSVTDLARDLKRPEQFVGIHFFNPVHRMKLVEIVRGEQSSQETVDRALAFVAGIGKVPVVVRDRPGFLVNRVLMPYLMEAVRLFEAGAEIEELDKLMLRFGMPMGPMRLIDEVGLDVARHVACDLSERLHHPLNGAEVLSHMIDQGWLGRKSGRGFYAYDKGKGSVNTETERLHEREHALAPESLTERMVLLMVNESARCLEEGVAERAEDIDLGMIMGTGWAPFRGGPLHYADHLGLPKLVDRLEALADTDGKHFKPTVLLIDKARKNEPFFGNSL